MRWPLWKQQSLHSRQHSRDPVKCNIPLRTRQVFFQHFRQNSAGRKLPKFQNSGKIFAKTHKFLLKLANFCSKLSFPAKLSNFYYIRVLEKLTDLVKTQPNFKTQPKISPKLSFPATPVAVHAAQSLKKKAWDIWTCYLLPGFCLDIFAKTLTRTCPIKSHITDGFC